jgi:hypothetical protein
MLDFAKHTVVVTGAGGGLGRVYVPDHNPTIIFEPLTESDIFLAIRYSSHLEAQTLSSTT